MNQDDLEAIWKATPKDKRERVGSKRKVMVDRKGTMHLVSLDRLTEKEVKKMLPKGYKSKPVQEAALLRFSPEDSLDQVMGVYKKIQTGDRVVIRYGKDVFDGVVLRSEDASWVTDGKKGFVVIDESYVKRPRPHVWMARTVIATKDGLRVGVAVQDATRGDTVSSMTIVKRGAYSKEDAIQAAKLDESLVDSVAKNDGNIVEGRMKYAGTKHADRGVRFLADKYALTTQEAKKLAIHPRREQIIKDVEDFMMSRAVASSSPLARGVLLDLLKEDITGGGAEVGDTENNWILVDTDSGGTISQGFGSREEALQWAVTNNFVAIPDDESWYRERIDPLMVALKREHPNIVWVEPPRM